ncbi:diacylglycerol O-acyltransferase 1 [Dinochytrium kinnereticum]|nr:diacylglycerol O-acyltransferase 1 [Dinochytrium kinnereticum]
MADFSRLPPTATMVPPAEFSYPPRESFLQLLAVGVWVSILPTLLAVVPATLAALTIIYPYQMLPILLAYFMYVYTLDKDAELKGGWGIVGVGKMFFNLEFWRYYREYFSARLVKTAELPADRNYVFSAHPHGVYCLGFFANVTGNPAVFSKVFPGIKLTATTLPLNFRLPLWREFILSLGMVSCDRKALERVLVPRKNAKPSGNALILITGGGEEYTYMAPNTMDLVIKKRKGFVKLALTTGASLVPIITFGENDLFTRIETPLVKKLTAFTQRAAHFAFPAFSGRWGPIPRRIPLTTVFGAPIHVTKIDQPTHKEIDDLHTEYLRQLQKLYDDYKDIFFTDRIREMEFVK